MQISAKISIEETKNIVTDIYGLHVIKIVQLNGYDDKNFHIIVDREVCNNGFIKEIPPNGYVVKIINSLNSQNGTFFEAQSALFLHLSKQNIQCPKPILTKRQQQFAIIAISNRNHIVRLLEYIDGVILNEIQENSPELFHQVGVFAATIDNALSDFDHPVFHDKIQWSLGSVPDILKYLHAVHSTSKQELVKKIVKDFSSNVLTVENQLQKGIIHGDINEQNIIIHHASEKNQWEIKAIIDFGECHYSCYLYDLALAMTYMIFMSNDLNVGRYVLNGYISIRRVPLKEIKLLKLCILARFCQSLVLGAYGYLQEPQNEYLLTTAGKGWLLLQELYKIPDEMALNMWGQNVV